MTNIIPNGEKLKHFHKSSEEDKDVQLPHLLFSIVIEILGKAIRQGYKIKRDTDKEINREGKCQTFLICRRYDPTH